MSSPEIESCRFWRKSIAVEDGLIGLYPAWNAVVALNTAAAAVWDSLRETGNRDETVADYAIRVPDRAAMAQEDVDACVSLWRQAGLLRLPPSPEGPRRGGLPGVSGYETCALNICIDVLGQSVEISVQDPVLGAAMEDLLADFPRSAVSPGVRLAALGPSGGWRLCQDGFFHRAAADLVELRGVLVGEIIRMAAGTVPWRAVVHGAVLSKGGKTVLLTGQSGSGKSTLSAEMLARGWKLIAEDCAAFDAEMRVAPMPFAFSFKAGSWSVLAPAFPSVGAAQTHSIGQRRVRYQGVPAKLRATRSCRPDLLVDVRFREDLPEGVCDPVKLCAIESLQLFLNEESFVDFEADVDDRFLNFAIGTPAWRLRYGSSDAAIRFLGECLGDAE